MNGPREQQGLAQELRFDALICRHNSPRHLSQATVGDCEVLSRNNL